MQGDLPGVLDGVLVGNRQPRGWVIHTVSEARAREARRIWGWGGGAGRGGETFPLGPEARKSWNQWPGQQRAARQEPRALVDTVPPAPLPACRRGREPHSPSAQRLGGYGSHPKVSPQGLEQDCKVVCRGRRGRASPAISTERAMAKPGLQGPTTCPQTRAYLVGPQHAALPGAGPSAQAWHWPQR